MPATPSFVVLSDESGRAERPRLSVNFTPRMASVSICDPWEKYSRAVWQLNISHTTFNIQHSQHPSPKSTRLFPSSPDLRSNTPFLRVFHNHLTANHLSSGQPARPSPTRLSPPRNAIFRPAIPALSRLHPLPSASRSLSYRNPIHAQRPSHGSPSVIPNAQNRLPALCFTQNPDTRFAPKIFILGNRIPPLALRKIPAHPSRTSAPKTNAAAGRGASVTSALSYFKGLLHPSRPSNQCGAHCGMAFV